VRVPRAVTGAAGLFVVDATWGTIQPLVLAPGVETFGELEVIAHVAAGSALVDCRPASYLSGGTIPTAVNIPHTEIVERSDELDRDRLTVLFCNGPRCRPARRRERAAAIRLSGASAGLLPRRHPRLGHARSALGHARALGARLGCLTPARTH
jgi:hypothetical protein